MKSQPPEAIACLGDVEFSAVKELVNFDTALSRCEARGAILARISNEEEHNFVAELEATIANDQPIQNYWFGMLYLPFRNFSPFGFFNL